jgi:hypothetical protein
MPNPPRKRPAPKSNAVLWIVVISLAAVVVLGGAVSVGAYFLLRGSGKTPSLGLPGSGRAALDTNSVENMSAWAADAVKRLKDADGKDAGRVEKELKDALLGKQVRWAFPVEAVDEGEVKLDSFFGTKAGPFRSDDPKLNGKPSRRLHLRVFFAAEKDGVKVGDEVTAAEAERLKNGGKCAVVRTVAEVELTKHDPWSSQSPYTGIVDALEPYCVTITLVRK